MENILALQLEITETPETANLQSIERINSKLRNELELQSNVTRGKLIENEMGIDAATAISLAGLTLSAINTALTVIEFYLSQRKNESIVIMDDGSFTRHITNLNSKESKKIISLLRKNKSKKLIIKVK